MADLDRTGHAVELLHGPTDPDPSGRVETRFAVGPDKLGQKAVVSFFTSPNGSRLLAFEITVNDQVLCSSPEGGFPLDGESTTDALAVLAGRFAGAAYLD